MSTQIKLKQTDAVMVVASIMVMTGSEEYFEHRAQLADKVKKLWPEITFKQSPVFKPGLDKPRELSIDDVDKKAIGEGLRSILRAPTTNGSDYQKCLLVADLFLVGKWFRTLNAKTKIPAFDAVSDDEPALE